MSWVRTCCEDTVETNTVPVDQLGQHTPVVESLCDFLKFRSSKSNIYCVVHCKYHTFLSPLLFLAIACFFGVAVSILKCVHGSQCVFVRQLCGGSAPLELLFFFGW